MALATVILCPVRGGGSRRLLSGGGPPFPLQEPRTLRAQGPHPHQRQWCAKVRCPHQPYCSASKLPPYALRAGRSGRDSLSSTPLALRSRQRVLSRRSSVRLRRGLLQSGLPPCLTSGIASRWFMSDLAIRLGLQHLHPSRRISAEAAEPFGLVILAGSNPPPHHTMLKPHPAARLTRSTADRSCFYSTVSASPRVTVLPRPKVLPSGTCRALRACLLDFFVSLLSQLTPPQQPAIKVRAQP